MIMMVTMMIMMILIMMMKKLPEPLATFAAFFLLMCSLSRRFASHPFFPILPTSGFVKAIVMDFSKLPPPITEAVAIGKFLQLTKF